jgi:hypothetical protein
LADPIDGQSVSRARTDVGALLAGDCDVLRRVADDQVRLIESWDEDDPRRAAMAANLAHWRLSLLETASPVPERPTAAEGGALDGQ